MKEELGGKGAGLAEMTNAGLPVPPGFTIQTAACREFMKTGKVSDALERQMKDALARLEELQKQKLGAGENPLLVSVRSGAKFSMPGMMDTILNLGLNDESVQALARKSGNERFAYDSYRRLIQMYGSVVMDIPKSEFEEVFDGQKHKRGVKMDTDLTAADLKEVIAQYKEVVRNTRSRIFPRTRWSSLSVRATRFSGHGITIARRFIAASTIFLTIWERRSTYRPWCLAIWGETSGTGVGFTRNPANGDKEFYGEFLMNAQGEDVVSGVRTPVHILELHKLMPQVYDQLRDITTRLEIIIVTCRTLNSPSRKASSTCCRRATASAPDAPLSAWRWIW